MKVERISSSQHSGLDLSLNQKDKTMILRKHKDALEKEQDQSPEEQDSVEISEEARMIWKAQVDRACGRFVSQLK